MRTRIHEVRCKDCNILLGKIDDTGFSVRRGEMEIHYAGPGCISVRCYRHRCKALNVLQLRPGESGRAAA